MSVRAVARMVGVSDSHLNRIRHRTGYKSLSGELAERIATALGLDPGYFVEARERYVIDRVRADPKLRDELYRKLRAEDARRKRGRQR